MFCRNMLDGFASACDLAMSIRTGVFQSLGQEGVLEFF